MPSQFWSVTEGMAPPLWYPQKYNLDGNMEDIAPTTDFTCTRYHWRTWQFFHQVSLEPWPSGPVLSTLTTGQPRPWNVYTDTHIRKIKDFMQKTNDWHLKVMLLDIVKNIISVVCYASNIGSRLKKFHFSINAFNDLRCFCLKQPENKCHLKGYSALSRTCFLPCRLLSQSQKSDYMLNKQASRNDVRRYILFSFEQLMQFFKEMLHTKNVKFSLTEW